MSRIAGSTEPARAWRRRPARVDVTIPLLGLRQLLNVLAATAVALEYDVPLDGIAETRSPVEAPRHIAAKSSASRDGITLVDDSYNSSRPRCGARSMRWRGTRAAGARGRARRDAGARRFIDALHSSAAGRGGGRCRRAGRRRRPPARRSWRTRPSPPASTAVPCTTSRRATRPPSGRERRSLPGDLVLVKGSRGTRPTSSPTRVKAEWR